MRQHRLHSPTAWPRPTVSGPVTRARWRWACMGNPADPHAFLCPVRHLVPMQWPHWSSRHLWLLLALTWPMRLPPARSGLLACTPRRWARECRTPRSAASCRAQRLQVSPCFMMPQPRSPCCRLGPCDARLLCHSACGSLAGLTPQPAALTSPLPFSAPALPLHCPGPICLQSATWSSRLSLRTSVQS